ncbi:MAG: phage terminase large subunit family protein [Gammaproteobacteria bacterium]|nr:phage terminase large subunit family protein [Gammaproteobacteria bacterium]
MTNASCAHILRDAAEILRPPRRIPVADAVEGHMIVYGTQEPWKRTRTPYLVEPMNALADRQREGVVFVGPSRSGKSAALVEGFLYYAVTCDPGDFHIIHMTQTTAQHYSRTRIDHLNRLSPALRERLSPYANDNNIYAKRYRNGMNLTIGWPSITQLSSFDFRYVALTDYDRYPEDVGQEGDVYTPARKRTQTFMSAGRILVESSPGKVLKDPKWQPLNPHEGPPCNGIFALYNQGDRRRWYWPCPHCGAYFTAPPSPEAFTTLDGHAALVCTVHGCLIEAHHKPQLNQRGVWLADGQTIDADGVIHGDPPLSALASYWLTGPAAVYQTWDSLLQRYQHAYATLERTGDEKPLQALITTDYGTAYRPRHLNVTRDSRVLANRAEPLGRRTLPPGVMFLTAAVDVHTERFVVQVIGWGVGQERWLIDRYNLRWSRRLDSRGEPEPIDPPRRLEDWMILLDQVACKPYPFTADPSLGLIPVVVAVDSGGKAGVTERAYDFWKKAHRLGLGNRIMLIKGDSKHTGPRLHKTYPDSRGRSDRKANAAGEVPVFLLNTLILKDSLAADLERTEPGPGYLHFPDWLGPWFYDELAAETRLPNKWENLSNDRNEAFDLCVYNHAAMLRVHGDSIHWERPPAWADPKRSAVGIALLGEGEPAPAPLPPPHAAPRPPRPVRRDTWGL